MRRITGKKGGLQCSLKFFPLLFGQVGKESYLTGKETDLVMFSDVLKVEFHQELEILTEAPQQPNPVFSVRMENYR